MAIREAPAPARLTALPRRTRAWRETLWGWIYRLPLAYHLRDYSWAKARQDLRAGVNVALLDFPQSMAYALIAGLPVQHGLHASALGSFTGPFFASSRYLMLGPTNATAILLLSSFATLPLPPAARIAALPLLLLMVAAFFFAGAMLNAGLLIRYVSRTVISGYVTAGGCLIIAHQLHHTLGLEVSGSPVLFVTLYEVLRQLPATDPASALCAATTLVGYFGLKRRSRRLPAVATVLVAITILTQGIAQLTGLTFTTLDAVPPGSWSLTWPQWDFALVQVLFGPALAIAFLALLESASIAKDLAARSGDTVDIPQQLVSMSCANAVNALGGGMPVSGSLTRSFLNWSSGARTPVSSLFSGTLIFAGIFAVGPLLRFVPQAALSALVIAVGIGLIDRTVIRTILRTTRADAVTFSITLLGGLLLPLHLAIFVGVTTSLLFFLHKVSQPKIVEHAFTPSGDLVENTAAATETRTIPSVSIVHVEGDLFFGATDLFLEQMRLLVRQGNLRAVLLRLRNAHHLDATSAMAIRELHDFARERGCVVLVTDLQPEALALFQRAGLTDHLGEPNIFPADPLNATLPMKLALKRIQALTGEVSPEIILFARPKTGEADQPVPS